MVQVKQQTTVGITGGKKNNMLYLSGIQKEKVLTDQMITKVVDEVRKKLQNLTINKDDPTENNRGINC